jgi:exodeoxyribonuclease VII large subunit
LDQSYSLSELNKLVKKTLQEGLPHKFTLLAEISDFKESRGHAYLELIEKSEDERVLAKSRATIWANVYRMIKPYFESTTGHFLRAGLNVLVVVTVEFHEVYGFSLNIIDIDPTYTVGDIEKKRQAILQRLSEEGVSEMNKELEFPLVPQRVALISSETAAGYEDFMDQLNTNEYGFQFQTKLFPAIMQGEDTERSVIAALEQVYEEIDDFDLVAIIRGGGSKSDLSWFDSYQIAVNIAQFPLPVLTGIGHDRDETVSDTVAYINLKTPTAAAEFLIRSIADFWNRLNMTSSEIFQRVLQIIQDEKLKMEQIKLNLYPIFSGRMKRELTRVEIKKEQLKRIVYESLNKRSHALEQIPDTLLRAGRKAVESKLNMLAFKTIELKHKTDQFFTKQNNKLREFEQKNDYLNPAHILKRGYSISIKDGKVIQSIQDIAEDDIITTKLIDGSFQSKVKK